MGMFNFLKNPFERLTAENQEDIKKSMDSVAESLTDKGPIFTKLESIDKRLETISTVLGDIAKKLDVKGKVKADAKEMAAMGETAKAMGQGMQWFVDALEGFAKIGDGVVDKFVVAIERIGEAFQKMEKTATVMMKAGRILIDMAIGVILFGLALLVAAPIYIAAIPGAIIAMTIIYGFMYFFSKALGDEKNAKKIHDGAKTLAMMGIAVILFGIAMLLVGVGVYTKLIDVVTLAIFGVMLAFIVLFAWALGKVLKNNIQDGVKSLALMGIAVILFGLALLVSIPIYQAIMKSEGAAGSGLLMVVIIGIVVGIFFLLDQIKGSMKDGAEAMFIMAGTILMLGLAIWAFGKLMDMIEKPWETMAMAGVALLGLALIMFVVGKIQGDVKKGAIGMVIATAAIAALAVALYIWQKLDIQWETLAIAGAAIAGLAVVMAIAGSFAAEVALGALALTLSSLPLFTLGMTLSYWQKEEIEWETLAIAGAAIGGLALVMGIAGVASPFIFLGAAAMLVAGAALISIAYGFKIFKKTEWEESDSDNLNGALGSLIAGFLGYKSINDIGIGAAVWVPYMAGLLILASAAHIVAGIALQGVSKGLTIFKKSGFTSTDGEELEAVMASVISAFTLITDKERQKKYGIDVSPWSLMMGTMALTGIGNVMTDLARGIQAFANMKFIEYEVIRDPKTGRTKIQPKAVVELSDSKIQQAGVNFGKVVDAILGPISRVGEIEKNSSGWFSGGFIKQGISALTGIGGIMTGMARGIQRLANLTFTTYEIYTDPKTGEKKIQPKEIVKLSDTDFVNAGIGFAKIVGAILGPISAVGKAEKESSGFWSDGYVKKGVDSLTGVSNIMTGLAKGIIAMSNLEFISQEIFTDAKGVKKLQPSEVVKLTDGMIEGAGINFAKIVQAVIGSMVYAAKEIEKAEGGWGDFDDTVKQMNGIQKIAGGFAKFAVQWSKVKNPEMLGLSYLMFTNSIMNVFNPKNNRVKSLLYFNMFADKLDLIASHTSEYEKIAASFERISASMGDFKDNVNGLDKDILTETRGLFDAMAIISKSDNGDKFLKKYSDSLKTTFEKLHDLLEEFKGSVDNNTKVQEKATAFNAAAKPQPVAPGIKPDATKPQQVDMSGVINAIKSLQTTLTTQGIKVKNDGSIIG